MSAHHRPAGTLANPPWALELTPKQAGWTYSSLRVLELRPGQSHTFATGEEELIVLPLAALDLQVEVDGAPFTLAGRDSVFAGPSDFVYAPRDSEVTVRSATDARVAFTGAKCDKRLTARYGPGTEVPVELRGAGQCSREVRNFGAAGVFEADKLIAVEVITPAGNWSSYPPHKHDEDRPGEESVLEEIYYFEVGEGPTGPGMAYQRVYGTAERPIDVFAEVRTGDVVAIPHGWHGPSMAVPGYDLYYLNVMAGPSDDRAWLICDDPAHGWIRETWADQPVDPRLPLGGHT